MIHPYVYYYQKKFIGADGKLYLMNGVLAVKKGLNPHNLIESWNKCYSGVSPAPYTLGAQIYREDVKNIKDNNGRSLEDASQMHHQNNFCAIVLDCNEV